MTYQHHHHRFLNFAKIGGRSRKQKFTRIPMTQATTTQNALRVFWLPYPKKKKFDELPSYPLPSDWRVASCPFPMPRWWLCSRVQLSREKNFPITRITWPSRVEKKLSFSGPTLSVPTHSSFFFFFFRPVCLPFLSIPHPHMSPSGLNVTIVLWVFFSFFWGVGELGRGPWVCLPISYYQWLSWLFWKQAL